MTVQQYIIWSETAATPNAFGMGRNVPVEVVDGDFGLISFRMKVRQNGSQHGDCLMASGLGNKELPMFVGVAKVARLVEVNGKPEDRAEELDWSRVGHFNANAKDVGRCFAPSASGAALNGNAAFAVKQSSRVSQEFRCRLSVHLAPQYAHDRTEFQQKKSANSANLRLGLTSLKENAEPSIADNGEGACREHIRTPKGMTCSDLRSNAKRTAEMTVPGDDVRRVTTVQDAKTAQILWYGTLGTNNRRKLGVLSAIDTTALNS